MKFFLFTNLLIVFAGVSYGAKILGIFPIPSLSHQLVFNALTMELAKRGHELTTITTDPVKNAPGNLKQIDVHNISYTLFRKVMKYANMGGKSSTIDFVNELMGTMIMLFNEQLEEPGVKDILKHENYFDLIIAETGMPFSFGFAHVLKAPLIGIKSSLGTFLDYQAIGCPTHPILYPDLFTTKLTDLTLKDKVKNFIKYFFATVYLEYKFKDITDNFMQIWFGKDCPSPRQLENTMDLFIVNTYPILSGIRPSVPAVVNVGGLHLKKRKPLPKDLLNYLDTSINGVIYISFGTNVLSKELPRETIKVLLDVFSRLPYNVIWKFEEDNIPGKPKNLKIVKWVPQFDLLGHPNVKLFITQGGQQSMEEAIQSEVPLIVIPFWSDQAHNADRVKLLGIGQRIDISNITRTLLEETIEMILANPSYKSNVTRIRDLINDEPHSGMEKAIWWIEYVIKHKGAKHLRSPAANATVIEYYMLNVIAVLAVALLALILIIVAVFKLIFKYVKILVCKFIGKTLSHNNDEKLNLIKKIS